MTARELAALFFVAFLCLTPIFPALGSGEPAGQPPASIAFSEDLEETLRKAKTVQRPVAVFFSAAWCPICGQMKKKTFRDPSIVEMADRYLWVMLDIDRNLSTARHYMVDVVPQMYLLDSQGRIRYRIQGFQEAVKLRAYLIRFLKDLGLAAGMEEEEAALAEGEDLSSKLTWTPEGYRSESICFSNVGYGPLSLGSQSPFQALRLSIRPRTPSTLGKGEYEARGTATWVNVWAQNENYLLDFEMLQVTMGLAYGITDTFQLEVDFQNRSAFGGEMDGFIEGFHDVFGIDQSGRDDFPRGDFNVFLNPPGEGPTISLGEEARGTFSRGLQLTLQHNVTCGTDKLPALSWAVTALADKLYTGEGEDLELDLGVSVSLSRRFGMFYLYTTLGYAWFGRDGFLGIELKDTQFTGLAAGEWRFLPRHALTLQYLYTEGLIDDFSPFCDPSHEITLGWKWEVIHRGVLEVGLIENMFEFDNSPDFGIHVGFSKRF